MKKVVLIGGGHGLSNIVKDFKNEDIDLTVIVSSSDDGGHTGVIRNEFKTVAVGDLRMVLHEFFDGKTALKEMFDYRFDSLHGVEKVSLGNLMILSLWAKYKDINKAIDYFKRRENIKANIFLSSETPLTLCAECDDGDIIKKEHIIGKSNKKIINLYNENESVCNPKMIEKIKESDIIVLCPGSLYTSVGAVLCIDEIKKAIKISGAQIVYVCNIMTQDGETLNYSVEDHENVLSKIVEKNIDRVIVNDGKVAEDILDRYKKDNCEVVKCNIKKDYYEFYDLVEIHNNKVIHNCKLTKKIILKQ